MNNRAALTRIEALLDESGFLTILMEGIEREPQGLKTNTQMVRLLMIGSLLSIRERGSATITSSHRALTTYLDYRDQLRLGVRVGPKPTDVIPRARLYYAAELLTSRLAFGVSVAKEIGATELARRRDVILRASNALLDYTAQATDVDDRRLALDATAIWAWARGIYYPRPTLEEIAAQEDPLIREALQRLRDRKGNTDDLEKVRVTRDSKKPESADLDAAWSGATAKNGGTKRFYGYYGHALVAVPSARLADDPAAIAPIVRRIELTRATDDVVDASLRMIDSLPTRPEEVLGDRHYSYKEFARWQSPLIARGIRQGLDLRSDEHKVIWLSEGICVDGSCHCRAMPREHLGKQRPNVFAKREEHEQFQRDMVERERYAHVTINAMDDTGRTKLRCPARAFKVACPLFPPSMEVAAQLGLPIVNTDLLDLESGEELPRSCRQDSFRITLPEPVAKLNQTIYWGTPEWYRSYAGRTHVEGVFGNVKNPLTENLSRGTIQKTGIVWAQLMVALMCATYNVRMIRQRHERLGLEWEGHALLTPDEETVTHVSLRADQEAELFADFAAGVSLDELEVHAAGRPQIERAPRHVKVPRVPPPHSPFPFWITGAYRANTAVEVQLR